MKSIYSIADTTRKWAENYAKSNGFDSNLCGLCAISSAKLFTSLKKEGYSPEIRLHDGSTSHVFVVVNDHIVDITASQFGMKSIEIVHECEVGVYDYNSDDSKYYWYHTDVLTSVKNLIKFQRKYGWPPSQIALSC